MDPKIYRVLFVQVEVNLHQVNHTRYINAVKDKSQLPNAIYGYPATWGRPINATFRSIHHILAVSQPLNACSPVHPPPSMQSHYAALVAANGPDDCPSIEKAKNLFDAGFGVMLLYKNSSDQIPGSNDGCVYMNDKDGHDNGSEAVQGMTGVSITHRAAGMLMELVDGGVNITITLSMPRLYDYDPAEAILWLIALLVIVIGSLWSGKDAERQCLHEELTEEPSGSDNGHKLGGILVITPTSAGSFVIIASTVLLILYFFMSRILMELLDLLFVVMSWDAASVVLSALLHGCLSMTIAGSVAGSVAVDRIAFGVAGCTAVAWYIFRFLRNVALCRYSWWVLQDILSGSIMVIILRTAYIPNLKVASILLVGALVYDVWWVFVQPVILGGGSVMVDVVTRGSSLSFGSIPMVLVVPSIWGLGTNPAIALLGLGDVVIPGLLVAAVRRWEVVSNSTLKGSYFGYLVVGYAVGLLLTFVALARGWGGDQGQPALLYLAPFTLGPALLLSWVRGEFTVLWRRNRKLTLSSSDECTEAMDDDPLLEGEPHHAHDNDQSEQCV
jgi:signal peptide peptidase-like protein 2B